ncbi:MAG: lipopolysaccharide biosynthesis protein [Bacteroidota bacterium]
MSQSLTSKTVQGIKWSSISTIVNAAIQIGFSAKMARLLDPAAFGIVGMTNLIIGFGAYFAQMGMMQALIQKQELTNEDIRAAFTSYFFLGLLFFGFFWVSAPLLAESIFNTHELIPFLRAAGFGLFLGSLSSTSSSLLRRNLDFKTIAKSETASYVLGYIGVGFVCAYNGLGAWSLILASLSQTLVNAILFNFFVRHDMRFLFAWKHYKPLFVYGSQTSFISFLEYICGNLDSLMIGRILGKFQLGIYSRAFYIVYKPTYDLTHSLHKVVFSSYSKLQDELEKLGKAYLSSIALIATMIFPISLGIMMASREIVLVLLGDQYTDSIPVLSILCLAIPFSVMSVIPAAICSATANLKRKIILKLSYLSILFALFFLLKDYGLKGFASALAIGECIQTLMYISLVRNILNINFGTMVKAYWPGILNGALVALAITIVSSLLRQINSPLVIIFACQILTGGIMQILLMFFFPHPILKQEIRQLLSKFDASKINNKLLNRYLSSYVQFIGAE